MKHITPLTKAPQSAQTILGAFLQAKYEAVENATNLKDFF